jgi:threonine synthase
VHATRGSVEQVSEAEIALAKAEIGAEGIGCEPASAVTLAGLRKFIAGRKIGSSETVVLLLTGHTLKDSEYTIQYHRGDLLRDEELTALRAEIDATRRNPVELDADPDQVLRILEQVAR